MSHSEEINLKNKEINRFCFVKMHFDYKFLFVKLKLFVFIEY